MSDMRVRGGAARPIEEPEAETAAEATSGAAEAPAAEARPASRARGRAHGRGAELGAVRAEMEQLWKRMKADEKKLDDLGRGYQVKNTARIRLEGQLHPRDPIYGAFGSGKRLSAKDRADLKEKLAGVKREMEVDRKEMERIEKALDDANRRYQVLNTKRLGLEGRF